LAALEHCREAFHDLRRQVEAGQPVHDAGAGIAGLLWHLWHLLGALALPPLALAEPCLRRLHGCHGLGGELWHLLGAALAHAAHRLRRELRHLRHSTAHPAHGRHLGHPARLHGLHGLWRELRHLRHSTAAHRVAPGLRRHLRGWAGEPARAAGRLRPLALAHLLAHLAHHRLHGLGRQLRHPVHLWNTAAQRVRALGSAIGFGRGRHGGILSGLSNGAMVG
jgi:hypothetical protein